MSVLARLSLAVLSFVALPVLLTAQGGRGNEPPKNLQVLPKDMPRQQVVALMRTFTNGLGVRCEYCHAEDPNAPAPAAGGGGRGGPPIDYSLDTKEQKKIAREMLKMVGDINTKYLTLIGRTVEDRNKVTCETCHHGLNKPQTLRAALAGAVEAKGADSSIALYRELRSRYYGSAAYDFSELSLTLAADELARANQRPAAISLLKLNLEFFAQSAPTFQSLAQQSLLSGDTTAALDALNKAIAIQPNNPQLQQMLQRIKRTP